MTWPGRYVYVAAIEGVDTLLTNESNTSAVAAAWAGTDWTSATSGLFVDLDQQQNGHPWEPFQPGGTLTLTIADDDIGILTHRTAGGAETSLGATVDQDDTTIPVDSTSLFPSSGVIHIGTETIAYSGVTSTTFTGCTRGKFSPFGKGTGTDRYAHNHRVGIGPGPSIKPQVTQFPRTWIGRWVGLWVHAVNPDGSLQAKADALRVFAGRLVEVRDDADLLSTILVCEHVLTDLREATIGRDMFAGELADGLYLPAGAKFGLADFNGSAVKTANDLVVVTSGAAGANQINQGVYSHDDLFNAWSAWLASELQAARIYGSYTFGIATIPPDGELRAKIYWTIPGSGLVRFGLSMPKVVALWMGFHEPDDQGALGIIDVKDDGSSGTLHHRVGAVTPMRAWVSNGLSTAFLRVKSATGTFQDQTSSLPQSAAPPVNVGGTGWGVFLFNESALIRAQFTDNGDGTYDLEHVETVLTEQQGPFAEPPLASFAATIADPTPIIVRQVFVFEFRTDVFLNALVYSGGTPNYNHATHDVLPYGIGLAYPGEIFGADWETSVASAPGADKPIAVVVDKPTKLSTLIGSDLVLRHMFPVWKSGGLRMATWQTPTLSLAIASLTESNKAEPSGRNVNHRSPTVLSARWAKNVIKINYNRDAIVDGEYHAIINIEDRTAIDDIGDKAEPFTIDARNTYTQFLETGAGIEDLVPNVFIPAVQLFTRPVRTLKRSIDLTLWDLAPGDIISVSDSFARDPTSGVRVVGNRPGIIVSHKVNPGGATPDGSTAPIVAEAEVMFIESNRVYAYGPSAQIDNTVSTGGFDAGYDNGNLTIRTVSHAYSESSEPIDAASFAAGDEIVIHEIDPSNPGSLLSWTVTIVSVSTTDIEIDAALTAWDNTKVYRVIPANYSAVQTDQQALAYQADDADGLVEDVAQPYVFGLVGSTVAATLSDHQDRPERHATLMYGDGKSYDVGSVKGFSRLVDNLIDHKTAIQCPFLTNRVMDMKGGGGTWKLVAMVPVWLSLGILSNTIVRYLKVAPFFRSSDASSVDVRLTLCPNPVVDDAIFDVDRGTVYSDATWSTSSTTWQKGTAATLTINIKDATGQAWLLVECTDQCETRGFAEATEQERFEI